MKTNKLKISVISIAFTILFWNVSDGQNPLSDPSNTDGWTLNTTISDEFNGSELDKTKWWILGENGDYRSKWKGRAPGQYAGHNVKVEGGELVLTSQWEPTFNFADEVHQGTYYGGSSSDDNSKPITHGCVMSETFFKYGYMEIRAKLADAPVVSAFWTTGYHSEIDMIEIMGELAIGNPTNRPADLTRRYRTNMINWDPDISASHQNWKVEDDMGVDLADAYHVYGFEWDEDYIKTYLDGNLVRHATRAELEANDQWRHDAPQELWFDNEVFSWYGLPSQADFANPVEFKIDYVRIWQKTITSPDFNYLGFEGPVHFQGRSLPWWNSAAAQWRIKNEKPATGDFSMRFQHSGTFSGNYTTFSPNGSLDLPAGSHEISFKIWIDPSTTISEMDIILENPWNLLTFDLTGVQKGEWVELSRTFNRNAASNTSLTNLGDRIRMRIQGADVSSSQALLYIDDILVNGSTLSVENKNAINFSIYPNPTKSVLNINSIETGYISMYDMRGRLVKTLEKNENSQKINIASLSKGIYVIKMRSGDKIASKKVVIE